VSVDPSLIAALSSLITAIGGTVGGILVTRSKVRIDDVAVLQRELDEAKADLEREKQARAADLERARTQHKTEIDELRARHDVDIRWHEGRVATLQEQLDARDRQITRLDRWVLAGRAYIAQLTRSVFDLGGTPPARPDDLD
jgi:C4-dicarboxylate-specific signal transduction histidine kinase